MIGSFLSRVSIMIFGYAYPAYECYKTVELNKPEIEQLRFWCQYWILVALLAVFERVGDIFISWLPFYSEAKLAFYMYLWFPKTRGATYVYGTFIRPHIAKHEKEIDRRLLELKLRAGDMLVLGFHKASSYGQTRFLEILHYVASRSPMSRTNPVPNKSAYVQQQQPQEQQNQVKMDKSSPCAMSPAGPQSAVLQNQELCATALPSPSPTRGRGQQLEQSTRSASPGKPSSSESGKKATPLKEQTAATKDGSGSQETTPIEEALRARLARLRKRPAAADSGSTTTTTPASSTSS